MSKVLNFISAILLCSSAYAADSATFNLTSSAVSDQGVIPVLYTCNGNDVSPQLSWSGAPANTKSFALILSDPDAPNGTFYHWVLYNIAKNTKSLNEGVKSLPTGTIVAKNSWGNKEYKGPCPPKGAAHHYHVTLYALDTILNLPADTDAPALLQAIQSHVLSKDELVFVYSKWPS